FRECAARALLLPRRRPGGRSPLWQQRQRSAQLLQVASEYGSFPIVLETVRECLQDVFDVPGLVRLMRDIDARRVRIVEVETQAASPFARSLLFGYVGAFMYEGDAPVAERRAQALALDTTLLAELLGGAELRELLDPEVVEAAERELQWLTERRRIRDAEDVADLLRLLGPLSTDELVERGADPAWATELERARRVIRVRVAGDERWAAVEDAARLRDALGVPPPVGVPEAFLEPPTDPLADLVSRYARTRGPFHAADVAARLGVGVAVAGDALRRLASARRVAEGEFRPGGSGAEWCDVEVLRTLRRRSLAALRKEVEPVSPEALARFLPAWHHIGSGRLRGADGVLQVIEQLQGAAVPASALESIVLPARVADYSPALLDELTSAGEVLWAGQGALPRGDGWVALYLADAVPLLLPEPRTDVSSTPLHDEILGVLGEGGALFFRQLSDRVGSLDDRGLAAALWDLVWAGHVTDDTIAPLRAALGGTRRRAPPRSARRRRPAFPSRTGPPTAAGRWSALPSPATDVTARARARADVLLDRHGVVTRGSVGAERAPGGFGGVYPVLKAFEEAGRCRRGYFVEGLGAAQFALPGAVDRMRTFAARASDEPPPRARHDDAAGAVVLAAADPANPYGAALPWPERPGEGASGHKPGRKAGALVVLVEGRLVLYVERGGRTLLSWSDEPERLQPAVDALALAVREGQLGQLAVERADGERVARSPLGSALEAAGFHPTPRGLRLRR
ncbi:MAG: Lhr family ATP-dependent helicase, partial [Nocardioidaceae bacterium]